jgi:DNA-binding response OmpR family regulator
MTALGRLLIVDDEEPVVEVLSDYFSGQGYQVAIARNGAEALAAVRRSRPDLVLLDVRMPGIDGVEVLRRIRALDAALPVIMVTANEDVALARETLKIGAFDYVAKPFDFAYLDRTVAAALARAGGPRPASAIGNEPDEAPGEDPWRSLARLAFRLARAMPDGGRHSIGSRLEAAALTAAREGAAARPASAGEHLDEIELLADIAEELGDLSGPDLAELEAAVGAARAALASGR